MWECEYSRRVHIGPRTIACSDDRPVEPSEQWQPILLVIDFVPQQRLRYWSSFFLSTSDRQVTMANWKS